MKLAGDMPPESNDRNLLDGGDVKNSRVPFIKRAKSFLGLVVVLLCVGLLVEGAHSYLLGKSTGKRAWFLPDSRRAVAAEVVERPSVVRPLDESPSVKKGDLVVLRPNSFSSPKVQQVAATPNQTVVIRRDGALDSIYMVGGSGYVVVSDKDAARIVRPEEIAGTLEPGSKE